MGVFHIRFGTGSHLELLGLVRTAANKLSRPACLSAMDLLFSSPPPVLGLENWGAMPGLFYGCWAYKLRSLWCMLGILSAEPSLQCGPYITCLPPPLTSSPLYCLHAVCSQRTHLTSQCIGEVRSMQETACRAVDTAQLAVFSLHVGGPKFDPQCCKKK